MALLPILGGDTPQNPTDDRKLSLSSTACLEEQPHSRNVQTKPVWAQYGGGSTGRENLRRRRHRVYAMAQLLKDLLTPTAPEGSPE